MRMHVFAAKKPSKASTRDPKIMAMIKTPVILSSARSAGLSDEQVKQSQATHIRKITLMTRQFLNLMFCQLLDAFQTQ
jgi:hypothetical protein